MGSVRKKIAINLLTLLLEAEEFIPDPGPFRRRDDIQERADGKPCPADPTELTGTIEHIVITPREAKTCRLL